MSTDAAPDAGRLPWHEAPWARLQRALREDRVPHAWLLNGPANTGKSLFAQAMARALLCTATTATERPCDGCRSCSLFAGGAHPDYLRITVPEDKREIAVDAVRSMTHKAMLTRQLAPYKVVVLEPLEAMGASAANALLKTLEEPPAGTVFVAVTARPSAVLPTILSRCQRLDMPLPAAAAARDWLVERAGISPEAALTALETAQGAPLRALRYAQDTSTLELRGKLRRDLAALMRGQLVPIDAAREWSKAPRDEVLETMLALGSGLVRRCLTEPQTPGARGLDVPGLYAILDEVVAARRAAAANLNAVLQLESLAIAWASMGRQRG